MPKKPGAYLRPQSVTEALEFLAQPDSVILAGGTKLLASESGLAAEQVIDLQALGLNQITNRGGSLNVGATATLAELASYLATQHPAESESQLIRTAIKREGPNTYRNAATIGGTVASRLPDSELLATLMVLEANLKLVGFSGSTEMSVADYSQVDERPDGLISGVQMPWCEGHGATERVARTPADYPIVSVVAWQPAGASPRLAATGLGSVPVRLSAAEAAVADKLDEKNIASASAAAGDACRHPGDFRGDTAYRSEMARVLTRRVLQHLLRTD